MVRSFHEVVGRSWRIARGVPDWLLIAPVLFVVVLLSELFPRLRRHPR